MKEIAAASARRRMRLLYAPVLSTPSGKLGGGGALEAAIGAGAVQRNRKGNRIGSRCRSRCRKPVSH